ncbi:MAG: hypothetical protein WC533_03070 [Candidatus Pacearchaeota archaeon]
MDLKEIGLKSDFEDRISKTAKDLLDGFFSRYPLRITESRGCISISSGDGGFIIVSPFYNQVYCDSSFMGNAEFIARELTSLAKRYYEEWPIEQREGLAVPQDFHLNCSY